jgi:hypothetical protein
MDILTRADYRRLVDQGPFVAEQARHIGHPLCCGRRWTLCDRALAGFAGALTSISIIALIWLGPPYIPPSTPVRNVTLIDASSRLDSFFNPLPLVFSAAFVVGVISCGVVCCRRLREPIDP